MNFIFKYFLRRRKINIFNELNNLPGYKSKLIKESTFLDLFLLLSDDHVYISRELRLWLYSTK